MKKFLKYINSRHQNIKFAFEEEHSNKIAFLEITTLIRVGDELQTSNKTFSGVYLTFNRHLPSEYE